MVIPIWHEQTLEGSLMYRSEFGFNGFFFTNLTFENQLNNIFKVRSDFDSTIAHVQGMPCETSRIEISVSHHQPTYILQHPRIG